MARGALGCGADCPASPRPGRAGTGECARPCGSGRRPSAQCAPDPGGPMPLADQIQRITALAEKARAPLVPLAPLLARLVFGFAFALTGYGKLTNLDRTIQFFT